MDLRLVDDQQKTQYNKLVTHVMQSWEWGEFRKSVGINLVRFGIYKNNKLSKAFQITFHKVPLVNGLIGYLPKGPFPDSDLAQALQQIGTDRRCLFIKVEPDIEISETNPRPDKLILGVDPKFKVSPKPYFTKYNFIIDLTQSEQELLKNMHPKTRYNIKLAEKKGVEVEERTDAEAFELYLKLYFETTKRQRFWGHNENYHKKLWHELRKNNMIRLLIAFYKTPNGKIPLSAWALVNFQDTLYYPYGGSSMQYKEVMANNLVAWRAIELGKKMGLKKFDMWGALGLNPNLKHPHFGFHNFKKGYGGKLVEYLGTFDLVFDRKSYLIITYLDKLTTLKVLLLKLLTLS